MVVFLRQLTLLAIMAPNVLGTYFQWNRCDCDVQGTTATVESFQVKFRQQDGVEAGVSGNVECNTIGARPDGCALWLLLEKCVDTGICGVGEICYNQEVVQSDKFKVNGQEYKKNDYNNYDVDLKGTGTCEALCQNYGYQTARNSLSDYGRVIEGWGPEPTACS
jgi:hypothetical protein